MKNKYLIYFLTLGCSKNSVDTDIMISCVNVQYSVTNDISSAHVIVVNTCGFIESAKEESINTILEASTYKIDGNCKYLIVTGCLAQRYPDELIKEIPEIDAILGTGSITNISETIQQLDNKNNNIVILNDINANYFENHYKKDITTTEYLRISEGCDNHCTYCIIPKLRGKYRSRKMEDILEEATYLANNGCQELILIAQNTSDYGIDLYGAYSLHLLLKELSKIPNIKWLRLMYLYPEHITDDLIEEINTNSKVLKYLDIPLQHINNRVLKRMNRDNNKDSIINLIDTLRNRIEGVIIRSTIIVGFPGETDEDFNELVDFITNHPIDRLGAFKYSREEDTPAYSYKNQISEDIKTERYNRLMERQQIISEKLLLKHIDKILEVIVEEVVDSETYICRSYMDAPEIDGCIYVTSKRELSCGDFIFAKITDSLEYDLAGIEYSVNE